MKASILLVEDDTSLGFVLSDQLRQDGYRVTLCSDGDEAFRSFNESIFHTRCASNKLINACVFAKS